MVSVGSAKIIRTRRGPKVREAASVAPVCCNSDVNGVPDIEAVIVNRSQATQLSTNKKGLQMNHRIDESIAARAYELWEQAGKPEGRDEEFWRLAEQELINEDKGSPRRTPDTL